MGGPRASTRRLAKETRLDFIDIHVYPLTTGRADLFNAAGTVADLADANGKRAIIGEAWLYKATTAEVMNGVDFSTALDRDPYPYWAPLDSAFIDTTMQLARAHDIELVSFFWAQLLFSYLPASAPPGLSPAQVRDLTNAAATKAMVSGGHTTTADGLMRAAHLTQTNG